MTETLSMRERIARAICNAEGRDPDAQYLIDHAKMLKNPQYYPAWHDYRDQADAVLEAIREPSEAMIAAGAAADWVGECESRAGLSIMPDTIEEWDDDTNEVVEVKRPGIWQSMIDAAIREGKDANG